MNKSELIAAVAEKTELSPKDFAQYKKNQMKTFAQLTRTTEEYLQLPGGQIIRRLMIPYAQGGVLILDERQIARNQKG